jgi:hypothetical protein
MAGNQERYRPQERAAGLFDVQLLTCQPLALIPGQRTKTRNRGGNFQIENGCSKRHWGRRALILVKGSFLLVVCLGH